MATPPHHPTITRGALLLGTLAACGGVQLLFCRHLCTCAPLGKAPALEAFVVELFAEACRLLWCACCCAAGSLATRLLFDTLMQGQLACFLPWS